MSNIVNMQTAEMLENPFPFYEDILKNNPVMKIQPGNMWAICRHKDVKMSLSNYSLFTSGRRHEVISPDWFDEDCRRDLFLVNLDPPEMNAYRELLAAPFQGNAVRKLTHYIEKTAKETIDVIKSRETIEVMEDIAYPYIGKIISHITGMERSPKETLDWIQCIENLSPEKPDAIVLKKTQEMIRKQNSFFKREIEKRRESPGDDYITDLMTTRVNGKFLTRSQLKNSLDLMIAAGYQTTAHLIASSLLHLTIDSSLQLDLVKDPNKIPLFVEEVLRFYPPIAMTIRHASDDFQLYESKIPKGSKVAILIAAANRDPAIHKNPNEFNINRGTHKHVSFGYGPHVCAGLTLARAEVNILLRVLLPQLKSITRLNEKLEWVPTCFLRGLKRLPVSLDFTH